MVSSIGIDEDGVRSIGGGLFVRRGGIMVPVPAVGGGGGGPDLASMTIPEVTGNSWGAIPGSGTTIPIPTTIQDNDIMILWACSVGGNAGGPSDGTWTLLINQVNNPSELLRVWYKRWHTGDSMADVPLNAFNGTGTRGILTYKNVDHIHADTSFGSGNATTLNPPSSWAAVGVGSRAVVFNSDPSNRDWPVHIGAENWRTDLSSRRWGEGGSIHSTADPAVWTQPCALYYQWWYAQMGGILLVGPNDYGASWDDVYVPAAHPVFINGSVGAWDQNAAIPLGYGPIDLQEGDLFIIGTGTNGVDGASTGDGNDVGPTGLWLLSAHHPSFGAYAHGRFISAAEAAADAVTVRTFNIGSQSHGGMVVRGVNPHCPVRRQIQKAWVNDIVFADVTAGVKTALACCVGSDAHSQYGQNFDHYIPHVRWNPQGAVMIHDVDDGEVVSGLHVHGNEGEGVASTLYELRGI